MASPRVKTFPESRKVLGKMFKLISCANCGDLPSKSVFMLGRCEHKYCERCVGQIAGNPCVSCKQMSVAKEASSDRFTSDLLEELKNLEKVMSKEDSEEGLGTGEGCVPSELQAPGGMVDPLFSKLETESKAGHGDQEDDVQHAKRDVGNKLDYHLEDKGTAKASKKPKALGGRRSGKQPKVFVTDDEDEQLALQNKIHEPELNSTSKRAGSSISNSKLKRRISHSSSSEDENGDFLDTKNKKMHGRKRVEVRGRNRSNFNSKTQNKCVAKRVAAPSSSSSINMNETVDSDVDMFEEEKAIDATAGKDTDMNTSFAGSPPLLTPQEPKFEKNGNANPEGKLTPQVKEKKYKIFRAKNESEKRKEHDENNKTRESPPLLTQYGNSKNRKNTSPDITSSKNLRPKRLGAARSKLLEQEEKTPKVPKKLTRPTLTTPNPLQMSNPKTLVAQGKDAEISAGHERKGSTFRLKKPSETISKVNRARQYSSSSSMASSDMSSSLASASVPSPSSVEKRNPKGETLLHVACRSGQLGKAKTLLDSKAAVNVQDHAGWTPLHEAVNGKGGVTIKLELVRLLLDHGSNPNIPGMDNESVLHEAARGDLGEVVKLLLSQSASPNVRNSSGKLPRDVAATEEIKRILDQASGYDPKASILASPSSDDPIVLEIQFSSALLYFCYQPETSVMESVASMLKIKVSDKLTGDVTHMVFPGSSGESTAERKVTFSYEYLFGLVKGIWMLESKWITDSLKVGKLAVPKAYEIQGCESFDVSDAPTNSRINSEIKNPGLFHGMFFYFYKTCSYEKLTKKNLGTLIVSGGGCVINREPTPDSVDPFENPVRFHAQNPNHPFVLTSHIILYNESNEPPQEKKFNMGHLKTLNVKWLIDSIGNFSLGNPDEYL